MQRGGVAHDYGTPEWNKAYARSAKAIEDALKRSRQPAREDDKGSDKGKGRR
ncbi:hypothetical protein Q0Z83_059870 [Actinoplanes sichuanensis]|uniref:Uncharacterized protein n=1 Tax=Actinoplanes sichuanensis TaxID=512349 RepID=A0ABW4A647_9ACTN|nr:hypothetical protein [Actinoplanes sichuanensis]BEL07796.1 hypothetical protein Q0Z83_059870 [Actinoplanes sichuanensis]